MTMPKSHLFNSPEPAPAGQTLTAICGEQVQNSEFVLIIDAEIVAKNQLGDIVNFANSLRGICRRCLSKVLTTDLPDRYVYGVLDGQEMRAGEKHRVVEESA